MLYNLVQYLVTEFPEINFAANALNAQSPDDCIVVKESGGTTDHDNGREDISVQFLSRSKSNWTCMNQIRQVYIKLKNRIGLTLPEVTVANAVYAEVKTYRIVPIQRFGYIGTSSENHHMYSFNSIVTLDYS